MLLSNNYSPSPALAPYVTRFYVFEANLPDDHVLDDWILSETAFVRLLIGGEWRSPNEDGKWVTTDPALLFGTNTKPLLSRVKGPFKVAGLGIRPSGWRAIFDRPASEYVDRLLPLADVWGDVAKQLWQDVTKQADDLQIVAAIENAITRQLDIIGSHRLDEEMAVLEYTARTDSTHGVEGLAAKVGLSMSQLARRCRTSFGITPKAVMRRSRFMDMATAMRGFTHPNEQELAALRFFDDSHLSREFRRYTGMTPRIFNATPTPLFTAGLKLRAEAHDLRPPTSGD